MDDPNNDPINVVVAMDFTNEHLEELRAVSPRLKVERHFPRVPDSAWEKAEVLYTLNRFPEPDQAPLLRWIQMHTAGMEHAMTQAIVQAEDLIVTSASGIHATQIAEFCLAMILAFNYRLPTMLRLQREANWPQDRFAIYNTTPFRKQTLGIVGYGSIGRELARQVQGMGVRVLATKRNVMNPKDEAYAEEGRGDPEGDIPERLYPPEALMSMASECDYLVVATPLTDATHHMINEDVFEAMPNTAVLVNIARGGVVDEAALISALAAEKIAGAALDVFEQEPLPPSSPLWNMDNVIISPHVSGWTADYHDKVVKLFAANLKRYINKRPLLNQLDRERGY